MQDLISDIGYISSAGEMEDNIFRFLVRKFKSFNPYEKPEILDLLSCMCQNGEYGIYINQEKVNIFLLNTGLTRFD